MRITKVVIRGLISTTIKTLLWASMAVTISVSPALRNEARADRYLDQSSPKIAHGMYKDRGKSSPKIAHGMYKDRGKSSPKIAHGMYRDRGKSSPKIAECNLILDQIEMALDLGELEMAEELLDELNTFKPFRG